MGIVRQVINEAIPALVKAKETGLVKHIGITGLPLKIFSGILDQVESGTVQTILSYCRHTLLDVTLSQQFDYLQVFVARRGEKFVRMRRASVRLEQRSGHH